MKSPLTRIHCPKCNQRLGALARFCTHCGTEQPPTRHNLTGKEQVTTEPLIDCNDEIHEILIRAGANYCVGCGTGLRGQEKNAQQERGES